MFLCVSSLPSFGMMVARWNCTFSITTDRSSYELLCSFANVFHTKVCKTEQTEWSLYKTILLVQLYVRLGSLFQNNIYFNRSHLKPKVCISFNTSMITDFRQLTLLQTKLKLAQKFISLTKNVFHKLTVKLSNITVSCRDLFNLTLVFDYIIDNSTRNSLPKHSPAVEIWGFEYEYRFTVSYGIIM
jgi:hypothetical protein